MTNEKREIIPETLTNLKEIAQKKFDTIEAIKPSHKPSKMKRIVRAITNTLSGENKVGEAIHGVFDLLPFPNQVIAKIFGYIQSGDSNKARDEFRKLVSFRNIVAITAFVLVATGVLSVDDIRKIIQALSELG